MRRLIKIFALANLALLGIAATARGQVPEKPPSPSANDDDWNYVSPGPVKRVDAGNIYLHRGALQGAMSRFEEALRDDPHYAPAYLGLGKVYERLKQNRKALDAFQRYLDELSSAKEAADAQEVHRAIARLKRQLRQK